jgi:hypothetical protein
MLWLHDGTQLSTAIPQHCETVLLQQIDNVLRLLYIVNLLLHEV